MATAHRATQAAQSLFTAEDHSAIQAALPQRRYRTTRNARQIPRRDALSGEADFVLNTPPKRADTVSEFIRYDEMYLAAPSTHPFALDPNKVKGLSKQDIYQLQNDEFIL